MASTAAGYVESIRIRNAGNPIRVTVAVKGNRVAQVGIKRGRHWELFEVEPGDDLARLWANGAWDFDMLYDLIAPWPCA